MKKTDVDTFLRQLKLQLTAKKEAIRAAHRSGASGFETCSALSHAMDETIRSACEHVGQDSKEHAAILALGGYGRGELSPYSDIDVMVLCDSGENRKIAGETARAFLHVLWDAGVDVGHSVRTIDEATNLHGESLDSWAGMLESRFICGSKKMADEYFSALRLKVDQGQNAWYINGILTDLRTRQKQYGNSIKLLEPNVKKSAGGLRDIHALLWLFRGTDARFLFTLSASTPATKEFLRLLGREHLIDEAEAEQMVSSAGFLLRTRHEMHYQRESMNDTLEYALQIKVAGALGFLPENRSSAVEVFMRQYYLNARSVDRLNRRLIRGFWALVHPHGPAEEAEPLGELFFLNDGTITIRPDVQRLTDVHQIFEAFRLSAEHDAELDFRLHGMIEAAGDFIVHETLTDPEVALTFRRILSSKRVGETLRLMNELSILGRYIPEFGELVAYFQHNVYHYFTADEHTLIALANAEKLREQSGVLHDVFRNIRRKNLLYLAILLHDIAKPKGVSDHEIGGVAMAETILERLGLESLFPQVAFLIRNHLVMEQVAFRRNIHDPQTIREFASRFDHQEQLDYLYLLTYADLSAVNINVWTDWKASMLRDLYLQTSEVLRRNLKGEEIEEFHESRREAAAKNVVQQLSGEISEEDILRHLSGIRNDAYVSHFSNDEIARHIEMVNEGEVVSVTFRNAEGYTEVTIIGTDAPFFLSHCCAVLSANDADIFDATIFTRDEGGIIDRFRVSDARTHRHLEQNACDKIRDDLRRVVDGSLDIQHLFEAHKRKWKRRAGRPSNPNTRVDVQFEDNPKFTIVDIYAPDSVGFLFRVTETISRLGLDIHTARIATRIDGVVDAFYVLEADGNPVPTGERREEIRRELLKTIRAVSEEQLSG